MSNPVRPKLAAIVTTYFKYSHAQHIVDRFLDGYGWNGTHHYPPMDLVSLYVDQVGANDLSRERAARHPGMKIYPTIAEALTAGGEQTGGGWRGDGGRARQLPAQRKRPDQISALRILRTDREGISR